MERDEKAKEVIKTSITVLVDDHKCVKDLLGVHGLSIYVELLDSKEKEYGLLFDVGPSFEVLNVNSRILGVDLSTINYIFLSSLINHHSAAYFEKNSPLRKKRLLKGIPLLRSSPKENPCLGFLRSLDLGGLWGERALLISHTKGWIALLGCSVHGLEWSLRSLHTFRNIYALIGGLGLSELDSFSFISLKKFVRDKGVKMIIPLHSTSEGAKKRLSREYKDLVTQCSGAGTTITI